MMRRLSRWFATRRTSRKRLILTVVLVLMVAGAVAQVVHADSEAPLPVVTESEKNAKKEEAGGGIVSTIGTVLGWIIFPFYWIMGQILLVTINLLVFVSKYNGFVNASVVKNGWEIVRDIANLFFIIILLVMAFGTVLGIQAYHARSLLGKFIIMVILVNFSKSIAGFMIDFAQVIMLTFVNAFAENAVFYLTKSVGIQQLLNISTDAEAGGLISGGAFSNFVGTIGSLILAVIMLFAYLAVIWAAFLILVVRVVMLWVLIVLSPIAYVMEVLPRTKSYANQWWSMFGKYVTVGPVMAFFLWLSITFMAQGIKTVGEDNVATDLSPVAETSTTPAEGGPATNAATPEFAGGFAKIAESGNMMTYVLTLVMLSVSMSFVQQSGTIGAQFAKAAADRVRKISLAPIAAGAWVGRLPGRGAKSLAKAGVEEVSARSGIELSPSKWKEGWQKAQKVRQQRREDRMIARGGKRTGGMQLLRTPESFFEEYAGLGGVGIKVGRFGTKGRLWQKGLRGKRYQKEMERVGHFDEDVVKWRRNDVHVADAHLEGVISTTEEGKLQTGRQEAMDALSNLGTAGVRPTVPGADTYGVTRSRDSEKLVQEQIDQLDTDQQELVKAGKLEDAAKVRKVRDDLQRELSSGASNMTIDLTGKVTKVVVDEKGNLAQREVDFKKRWEDQLTARRSDAQATIDQNTQTLGKSRVVTDAEKSGLLAARDHAQEELETMETVKTEMEKNAQQYRTPVDYEMRLQQRSRIAEEKKLMQTENWHELLDIIDDSLRRKDFTRASAAYQKATESGNENEIQNAFGADSGFKGMKEFIMTNFVGTKGGFNEEIAQKLNLDWEDVKDFAKDGMGMSMEQALAMANDTSYIAEKNNHWEVARGVTTRNGKQDWQDPDDRYKEQLIEVGKLDFENFNRRANRLAHGVERPRGETMKERMMNFRATGQRDFTISPFGLTYLSENFDKFKELLPRGRFNNSLAENITNKKPLEIVTNFIIKNMPLQAREWEEVMKPKLVQFAGSAKAGSARFKTLEHAFAEPGVSR